MKRFYLFLLCYVLIISTNNIFSQNVGVGTAVPASKLDIIGNGTTSATSALHVQNSAATSMMIVQDDGMVGIGVATPTNRLEVVDPNNVFQAAYITTSSATAFSAGLYAEHTAASGFSYGAIGSTFSSDLDAAGVWGFVLSSAMGVRGESFTGVGTAGITSSGNTFGGFFLNAGTNGNGLISIGNNLGGIALPSFTGIHGTSSGVTGNGDTVGVFGFANSATANTGLISITGVLGTYNYAANTGIGVAGYAGLGTIITSNWHIGVHGMGATFGTIGSTANTGAGAAGVYGVNFAATVPPVPTNAIPLSAPIGVRGEGPVGVYASGTIGVVGRSINAGAGGTGVFAVGNYAGTGAKFFLIDHPLDPANKILRHACLESNEILNVYRGNIKLDNNGEAIVSLPDYFDAVNINFSYHLTPIGGSANLFVKEEIQNRMFVIAGGRPNMKVSWMVYAERNDPYIQQNPSTKDMVIEKPESIKGKYYVPKLYNQPETSDIFYIEPTKTQQVENVQNIGQPRLINPQTLPTRK